MNTFEEGFESSGGWSESSYNNSTYKDKKLTSMSSVKTPTDSNGGRGDGVLDLTTVSMNYEGEQTPLIPHHSSTRSPTWKRYCTRGFSGVGCFPDDPSYESIENFPCLFRPFNYFVRDRFPIIKWLRRYSLQFLISDIIAGISVGLMVVPQALAYASIAGLPLQYGLYSSFMGVIVYMFFGTSKDVTLGPTAIMSLLTASIIGSTGNDQHDKVPLAILLTLFSGLVQFTVGILNLGFLIDFIPQPVISGFTSAAAITIAFGQVKSLLGITVHVRRPFIYCVYDTFRYITHWRPCDFGLGVFSIILVLFLRYFKTHNENIEKRLEKVADSKCLKVLYWIQKIAHKFLWIFCTGRNAVIVLGAGLVGFAVVKYRPDQLWLTLVDYESEGQLPPFKLPNATIHNIKGLGIGIVVAPFIGFLESIAISKAFARKNMYLVDPTQELIALGLSNVVSSFFGSYPVTGSFSRTAVNSQSGVKTPAAGILTCSVVLLAAGVLSQGFDYIPKTSLAAIIIAAVLFMVDFKIVYKIFKIRMIEDITLLVSFFGTLLLGIEYGVPIATVLSLIMVLYRHSRPRHKVKRKRREIHISFNGGWTYPGVEYVWKRIRNEIQEMSEAQAEGQDIIGVVLHCSSMPEVDFSVVEGLREGCNELAGRNISVILVDVQAQVLSVIQAASIANLHVTTSQEITTLTVTGFLQQQQETKK